MVNLEDITKVARLAKISLTQEEIEKFSQDLAQVFQWAEQLDRVCLESHSHTPKRTCPMVDDITRPPVNVQNILSNAPQKSGDYFVVPNALGDA